MHVAFGKSCGFKYSWGKRKDTETRLWNICNVSFLIQRHAMNEGEKKTNKYLQFTKNHFSVKTALYKYDLHKKINM